MLIALNEDNNLIDAQDDLSKFGNNTQFKCPSCKSDLILKKGTIKIPHFAHKNSCDCNSFSEGETSEHLLGKKLISHLLENNNEKYIVEAYLSEFKQRPDILWKTNSKNIAIEFQCSPLDIKRMQERSLNYENNGYKVIWILGEKLHIKNHLTNLQKSFINMSNNEKLYCIQFNVYNETISILYNFTAVNHSRKILYDSQHYSLKDSVKLLNTLSHIETLDFKDTITVQQYQSIKKNYTRSSSYYSSHSMKLFLEKIYVNHDSLVSIPIECYVTLEHDWMISSSNMLWKYYILKYIKLKRTKALEKTELKALWEYLIIKKLLIFYNFPLLNNKSHDIPLKDFCIFLVKQDILKIKSRNEWVINKKPVFYMSEYSKRQKIFCGK